MKKHTKQIISGVALLILGGIIIPVILFVPIIWGLINEKPLATFIVPTEIEVSIEKEGKYYLWNNYRAIFEGRTYSSPETLPLTELELIEP